MSEFWVRAKKKNFRDDDRSAILEEIISHDDIRNRLSEQKFLIAIQNWIKLFMPQHWHSARHN